MAGGGWQHLAVAAKELAGATGTKAKAVTQTLGKAVLATSKEVRHLVLDDGTEQPGDGQHVQGPFDQSQEPQVVVDAYGFSLTVMPDQAAILERCRARQEAVRQKWAQHVQEGGLPPPDALKKLCRKGIPPDMRRQLWLQLSGAAQRRLKVPPHYYADAALQGASSPFAHQIELDVPRTFPNNEWVQSEAGQNAVRHVLLAAARHNPRVGYCQSMNYLAAMLLLALGRDEEDAFWVLASLIDDNDEGILYRDMYARDLTGTHVEMRCLRELVQHKLPRLAAHMDALACDMSILATDWFLCLFCTSLPSETAARVWDALLHEGTKVLFRVALALLKLHEGALLAQDNPGELLRAARRVAAEAFDRDALMQARRAGADRLAGLPAVSCVAFEGVGSMPMERINSYRARKQREVDREMAERETRVNLRQAVAKDGFVLQGSDAELLRRQAEAAAAAGGGGGGGAAPGAGDGAQADGGGGAPRAGGGRWAAPLRALGGKAKDTLDRGRIRITHRRGQSLGASPLPDDTQPYP
ncbi:hypothetical protein CHLNCDRAFT_56888 [Chlorella variabilis]|uniref:Rab-GAP TBC domain-containing protein n=1 Tax=Chlorella variabilis TaxID=554065 RepID=E1Z5N3_CHLVA|nr:hypothetical protein CHLNCDRAFT_56888 [Chlorella variabilis]EFN58503.1 hypothetical protein CHLNCDRAFT_56888 [Chlorella variabilis]|eukprot:XP_005850605.1 hypothetical protein CHLNCDRAFT_56888 [Chlorella variabilis]